MFSWEREQIVVHETLNVVSSTKKVIHFRNNFNLEQNIHFGY